MAAEDLTYEDLMHFTNREIQLVLREVDTKDLAVAMMGTNTEVNERWFANVSNIVGDMLREDMSARGKVSAIDATEVQSRIVKTVFQLRDHGQITWPKGDGEPKPKREMGEAYFAAKERVKATLAKKSCLDMSCEEITETIVGVGNIARTEGLLQLDTLSNASSEDILLTGMRLAAGGTAPELIKTILRTRTCFLVQHCVTTYRMMMESVLSMLSGDNPRIVEQKLRTFYVAPPSTRTSYEGVLISDLKTKVQNAPQALWMFDEVTDLMTDASIFTRWQGVAALEPLVSLAKLKYLKLGLRLTIEEAKPDLAQDILKTHLELLEPHLTTKCRMVMEGILSIQSGDHPSVIESKIRTFFDFD